MTFDRPGFDAALEVGGTTHDPHEAEDLMARLIAGTATKRDAERLAETVELLLAERSDLLAALDKSRALAERQAAVLAKVLLAGSYSLSGRILRVRESCAVDLTDEEFDVVWQALDDAEGDGYVLAPQPEEEA